MHNPKTNPESSPDEEIRFNRSTMTEILSTRKEVTDKCYNLIFDALKNSKNKNAPANGRISPDEVEKIFLQEKFLGDLIEFQQKGTRSVIKLREKAPHHPVLKDVIKILNENPLTSSAEAFNILSDVRSRLNKLMTDQRPLITQIIDYLEKKFNDTFPPPSNNQ